MTTSIADQQRVATDRSRLIIGLIVALYWAISVFAVSEKMLGEPDLWWHIKTGEWIWQHHAVPTTDPFSYTFAGHPWIAKEWLSQVIYFVASSIGGWGGVLALGAIALGLAAAALYMAVSEELFPSLAAAMALCGLFLASPSITIRPHLLTLPIIIIWTHQLFKASRKGHAPNYFWLLLLILWANLHAAFTVGFVIAFFAFLDFVETTRLGNRRELLKWIGFLVLCPLVTLIHPYTYQAMLATWLVVGPNDAVPLIDEWRPFDAQAQTIYAVCLLGLVFASLASGFRLGIARSLFLMLLSYLFLTHLRYGFFLFPILPLIVAADMAEQFPRYSTAHWRLQPLDRVDGFFSARFKPLLAAVAGAYLVAFVWGGWLLKAKPPERVAATAAISYVKTHGVTGHVMNFFNFGGPLVFNDIQTFIDGRVEQLFLGNFIKTYAWGPDTEAGMKDALKQYDVSWTIMPPDDKRVALLDKQPGWKRVYADEFAVVHQRQDNPAQ